MNRAKETAGIVFDLTSRRLKKKNISDCISIVSFEDGFILNRDGSLAIGFEANLLEEEQVDEDALMGVIQDFSAACKRLPAGTVIQKMDLYYEEANQLWIPEEAAFFHRKSLEHHRHKTILQHRSLIFVRFFTQGLTPISAPLALYHKLFQHPYANIQEKKEMIASLLDEFVSFLPSNLLLQKLSSPACENLLYQYCSLTFDRQPIGFECSMVASDDKLAMHGYVKSIRMNKQADEAFVTHKNDFGSQGVTSAFMWPVTHFAAFPHIICQQIEIIDDEQFRKNKSIELDFSAQLKLGNRGRALAEHVQESFIALEKELQATHSKIVKLHYNVLVWDASEKVLQKRVNYIKAAFGRLGIQSDEEGAETTQTFFANIPGGTGFVEGLYMPLETAVAHLNFITPRKGDPQGILLADRHGNPIYYDPFKYSLDNQHAFVFGPTGSGKSFFNGKMIKDRFYAGHTMVVIDSGGTYQHLCKALGGQYIAYNPENPLPLNPFLIEKKEGKYFLSADKIDFLVNFLAKIWKGNLLQNPLSELEYAILAKSLTAYYQSLNKATIPTLYGFSKWLGGYIEQENIQQTVFHIENFLLVLEPFTDGIYKAHFNAPEAIPLAATKLICFELEAVKANTKLYPLVMKVLFEYVLQLVANQPEEKKFIDIEEGWSMLDDASKDYIEAFFRKGRKTNTSIRIITQNIDEIKHSAIASAMKNNAATFILLYNDKESVRNDIAAFLGMNDFDQEKYASLMRKNSYKGGFREVFIKEMDKSAVWRVELSLFEHAILTSRPDERNALAKLLQERGDMELAVCAWVKNILAKETVYA